MVTKRERKFIFWMLKLKLWSLKCQMRLWDVVPCRGTRWILRWIKKRQVVDSYHHAPCCPANHYHRSRLVFDYCSCGATKYAEASKESL